jgi:hypothetical protein
MMTMCCLGFASATRKDGTLTSNAELCASTLLLSLSG